MRSLDGGWLLQEADEVCISISDCKVVSKRKPTTEELEGLEFGWKVVKHVKSNAILFSDKKRTVGIGAGQMSRIDSVKIATFKSIPNPEGTVMASDAFFPFPDCVEIASKEGINAVIQPGGSVKDDLSIEYCNKNQIGMVFTGIRHFKH